MKELLWKDYRLIRPMLLGAGIVLAVLYVIGGIIEIKSAWPQWPTAKNWADLLIAYGTVILFLTCCITALLGGHAIACERGDRSANFLAYLPPKKTQILVSKLIIAAGATAMLWGWILISIYVIAPRLVALSATGGAANLNDPADTIGQVTLQGAAAMCVLTFGVGWLGSAFMGKSVGPIVMALASPVVVGLALTFTAALLAIPKIRVANWANTVCLVIGIGAFLLGTWSYCRRVEP